MITMRTSDLDEEYDTVVAVHGFNPLAPQDPDTKDFRPVAQDRIREAYQEVQRQEETDDILFVLTGGSYKERLEDHLTENGHSSVEEYDLPSEAELMKNQLTWMYENTEDGDGRVDADETGWDNEHGEYTGDIDDINADIVLEGESQDTEENIHHLSEIVDSSGADRLYMISSRDHWQRGGTGTNNQIKFNEESAEIGQVYSISSSLSYAAPEKDAKGNITDLNPDVFFGERGNKLRPVIDVLDDDIWALFGDSREKINETADEIRDVLNR